MLQLREQAEKFGLEVEDKNVEKVNFSEWPFKVWVEGEIFQSKSIIICTGAESIWLGAEGEEEQKGRGISTCATCDGAFFRDEEVLVIGGGDSAMEEATFLTRFASKVTIIHRSDNFKASKVMYERAFNNPKIEIKTFKSIKSWNSNEKGLSGAILEDSRNGRNRTNFLLWGIYCHRTCSQYTKISSDGLFEIRRNGVYHTRQYSMRCSNIQCGWCFCFSRRC